MTSVRAQKETLCGDLLHTNMVRSEASGCGASLAPVSYLFTPIDCERTHVSTLDQSCGGKQTGSFNCADYIFYIPILKSDTQSVMEGQLLTLPFGLKIFSVTPNDSATHSNIENASGSVSVARDMKFETSVCYEPIDRDPGPGLLAFSRLRNPIQFLLNNNINHQMEELPRKFI